MPTYVYRCEECGERFESLRSMKDADAPIECSHCHSMQTKRCLTTCGVQMSGSSSSHSSSSSSCGNCSGGSCSCCGH